MNLEHHTEQMAAHRRDFLKHWETCLLPAAIEGGHTDPRELVRIQIGAWKSWLADDWMTRMGIV